MRIARRGLLALLGASAATRIHPVFGADLGNISPQPYFAQVRRALETLARLGAPITAPDARTISFLASQNNTSAVAAAEIILERYTLAHVTLEPDGYPRTSQGGGRQRSCWNRDGDCSW
jgi:hypothetical protein